MAFSKHDKPCPGPANLGSTLGDPFQSCTLFLFRRGAQNQGAGRLRATQPWEARRPVSVCLLHPPGAPRARPGESE